MNSQNSFSIEDRKEVLSTPKFRINKSIYSLEREENTLDTIKQNMNTIINLENNHDTNNDKNNEMENDISNKNYILSSLLNKINNKNELKNYYNNQFSFDGKSKNLFTKNEKDNKENLDNNIIIIKNNLNDSEENINNNEIKYINDAENNIFNSNGKNNENVDTNFNYILPLESDKSSEHINLISFQGYSEEIEEKKIIKFKNIPNQKKISGENKISNNPEIINKKRGIGYLSKQTTNTKKIINKSELKLTPHKKNKNNRNIINKLINSNHKIAKSNNNSGKKKRNYNFKIPSLIGYYKNDICLTEPNKPFVKLNTIKNSQKNTFYTSNNSKALTPKQEIKIKIKTKPFIIEQVTNNKKDTIKKISYLKKNPIIRNSVNFSKKDINFEQKKNILIYEKNLNSQDSRSFSINKEKNKKLLHTRNFSLLNNDKNNITYEHSILNKKIKNCVILLNQKDLKNSPFQTRKHSFGNNTISASDSSAQRTIKKIKEGKFCSPFYKSKILNKKFCFNKNVSSVENRRKNHQSEKYEGNHTFISSNEINNDNKFIVFCNYDSNKNKSNSKSINTNKEKQKPIKIKKIKVNTTNNTLNNTIKNSPNNRTSFMNYNKNKPNFAFKEKKGNLTERFKNFYVGPANIYSKKLVFINNNNSNTNIYSTINNDTSSIRKLRNNINKKHINKSSIINNDKNLFVNEFNNSNNSNNNSILIKDKNKFHEYFNEILANIDIKENNFKKLKAKIEINKNNNTLNKNSNLNVNYIEKKILSSHKINSIKPKVKFKNRLSKNTDKFKNKLNTSKNYNNINNNINLGYENKFRKNQKISKKNTFTRENSLNIPNFQKKIEKYSILKNNRNNQVISEVSIYIGKQNSNNKNENTNLEIYNNKKEKSLINDKKLKAINVNKKTIINVNQFYPSYYINNNENKYF